MSFRTHLRPHMLGRNLFAARLFEDFLVSAVASIVLVRIVLALAGYPRLEGGGLHIAHVLWGGLGMLVAIVILLASLSPPSGRVAAIIGGIGFGVFIDELGKLVTSDNNYFFEPAIAIIYVIFIVLYLGMRGLIRDRHCSEETSLINALEIMKSGVLGSFSSIDQQRTRELLARCDPQHPLVRSLTEVLHEIEISPAGQPGVFARIRQAPARIYARVRTNRWFAWAVMSFFIGEAVVRLALDVISTREIGRWLFLWIVVAVIALIVAFWKSNAVKQVAKGRYLVVVVILALAGLAAFWFAIREVDVPRFELAAWGEVVSSGAAHIIVVIGLLRMRTSRMAAFKAFRLALLILIFLTQFFAFYRSQLTAGVDLAVNLVIYGILRYMMDQEESAREVESLAEVETIAAAVQEFGAAGTSVP